MFVIHAVNVNEAYYKCMMKFRHDIADGSILKLETRGQLRYKLRGPLATQYSYPRERVLFDATRDANPFFHFMEALWILSGSRSVEWLTRWLPNIQDYSDDGETFHGAYGYRMQLYNQVELAIERLKADPNNSRTVIAIYQPETDAEYKGKDLPCNCTLFLGIDEGRLNLTVANRSNDMIWGAYGANVVQFSTIQEYLAYRIGVKVGWYCQVSNNAHIYPDTEVSKRALARLDTPTDYYDQRMLTGVRPYDMFEGCKDYTLWDGQLVDFMYDEHCTLPYFKDVAVPIAKVHRAYKDGNLTAAKELCVDIAASDWRVACTEWIERRIAKKMRAA